MQSVYFYVHSVELQDRLILDLNAYFTNSDIPWFFIRYWHGGPHVRVRFVGDPEGEVRRDVLRIMSNLSERIDTSRSVKAEDYYQHQTFDGEDTDPAALPWYEQGTILETVYVPETDRYGEGELLAESELLFRYSSELIAEWLAIHESFNSRVLFSFCLFRNFLVHCGGEDEQAAFLRRYHAYWSTLDRQGGAGLGLEKLLPYTEKAEKAVAQSAAAGKLGLIHEQLAKLKKMLEREDHFLYLLSSHLHMTNNRLSITPGIEAQIAALLIPAGKKVS